MTDTTKRDVPNEAREPGVKKPYTPPTFRYEHVFEVSALSCGKLDATQASCITNRKLS
jgi:hypothetical protein